MSNQKGVVMRVTGKKTVVYTTQGDFIQITTPPQNPLVGQTIEFCIKSQPFLKMNALFKYAATAAVLFFVFALGLMYPIFWPLGGAVASVELNINDGISLQLNKDGKVTHVHNTGAELNSVDDGLPLKGMDVYQAVKLIVEDAALKGDFGHEHSVVMVSVVPVVKSGADAVDSDKLRGVVHEELLKQNANGVVMVGELSRESGTKAQSLGMTANNYLVYERCQRDGLDVQADVFRGRNVQEAMVEVNVSLPKLFPGEYLEVIRQDDFKTENKEVKEEVIVYTGQVQEQITERVVTESRRLQPGSRSSILRGNEEQVRVYKYEEPENGVRIVSGQSWSLGSITKKQERQSTVSVFDRAGLPIGETWVKHRDTISVYREQNNRDSIIKAEPVPVHGENLVKPRKQAEPLVEPDNPAGPGGLNELRDYFSQSVKIDNDYDSNNHLENTKEPELDVPSL